MLLDSLILLLQGVQPLNPLILLVLLILLIFPQLFDVVLDPLELLFLVFYIPLLRFLVPLVPRNLIFTALVFELPLLEQLFIL
mmetsp:Transcript_20426/g.19410  ORF Transcript_20426/g.19410 Transcript_20426/m.19410 type:complete len:83 (-) Transcript_20426:724-972(-)